MRAGTAPAGYSRRYRGDLAGGGGAMSGAMGRGEVVQVDTDFMLVEVGR
jgi:hypothetical protein